MPSVELKAPAGKYRVLGVDTFDNTDWHVEDYNTLEEAKKHTPGGPMLKGYVYDERGHMVHEAGTF